MNPTRITDLPAAAAGTIALGGELTVHRMGFGAMRLTGRGIWGQPADRAEAVRVLCRAVELGVNFIDTADSYGPYVAEDIIAEALYPVPEGLVIATKAGLERPGPDRWTPNGRPELPPAPARGEPPTPQARADRSLAAPSGRSGGAGGRAVRRHSRVPAAGPGAAARPLGGLGRPDRTGPADRGYRFGPEPLQPDRPRVGGRSSTYCEREGMAFIPWFPLSAGALDESGPLARVAARHGATVYQIALAWLLARSPPCSSSRALPPSHTSKRTSPRRRSS